jgi:hypothetical protein
MPDMNPFLSVCAQTAGAIVAIVGGFLVTRLVSISAERNGVVQALTLAERRLDNARARRCEAELELRNCEARRYRASVLHDIVAVDQHYTPGVLMQRYAGTLLSESDLRGIMDQILESATRARAAFERLGDDERIADWEFEEAAAQLEAPPPLAERDVFEAVFEESREEVRDRIRSRPGLGFPGHLEWMTASIIPLREYVAQGNERALMSERHIEAKIEVDRAESEVDALRAQVKGVQKPTGLLPAWCLLAYLSAVGVGLPLALLPAGETAIRWRIPVLVLFLVGLAGLLVWFVTLGTQRPTARIERRQR